MLNLLERLCACHGVSGDEEQVRDLIIEQIKAHGTYQIDALGNIICFKKGRKTPRKSIQISAHMDEVGMIVTGVNGDGLLKFTTVGGIDERVILGRAVNLYRTGTIGVIGTKAIHQQTMEERGAVTKVDNMFIDIGASNKEDALAAIALGDRISFISTFEPFGNGFIKGRALDDRIGCAVLIKLLQSELEYDATFTFVVQEEVGLYGAKTASFTVNPDIAIVVESTTAADISGVSGQKQVCKLGQGAVVGFMDGRTIYSKKLYQEAFARAKERQIPCQTKTMVAGGNDAGVIQTSRGGVETIAVSVPTRYLHSASCVVHAKDIESVYQLVKELAEDRSILE